MEGTAPFSYSIYGDTEEMHLKFLPPTLILALFVVFSSFICCNCHQDTNGEQERESLVSEDVEVKFVTRVRRKRGLDSHSYHIVEVLRPASNTTMKIQLSRSDELLADNFRFSIQDGSAMAGNNSDAEAFDRSHCVYSGTVTGTSSDSKPITGEAVLSACNVHEGLSGLVTTNEGQFFLQPLPAKAEAHQSFAISGDDVQADLTIQHALSRVEDGDEGSNVQKCGGSIYAPEYKPLDGQPSEDGNIDQLASGSMIPLVEPNSPDIPSPMAQNGPETYKRKAKSKTSNSKSHLIELAVFVDETCLAALEKKLGTKSVKALKSYVITLVQMMSIIYQRPSMSQKVEFKLVRIEFLAKNPSEINTHQGTLVPFLDSFCAYASKVNANGLWDHSLLLTGVDLKEGTFTSPVGVAFTRGLCTTRHACSVVEGTSFSAGTVMAHEVGHSFGMEHDGEKSNDGCDPKAHVMAALVGPNQPTWSVCSNNNMDSFVRKLASTSPNVMERGYCLQRSTNEKYYKFSKKLPGESYSADAQCAIQYPDKPKSVTPALAKKFIGHDMSNMCEMLWCTDVSVKLSFSAHPALEGTACATGKWCRGGKCVKKG